MMVTCPSCGNDNDPQSKFCSTCGAKLAPRTEGRCPECNAVNPVTNLFCDECGARLVPAKPAADSRKIDSSVRGLSLPSKTPAADDETPDWLAQLRASFSSKPEPAGEGAEDEGAEEAAPPESDAAAATGMPVWLREIAEETSAGEEGEAAASRSSGTELPGWLADLLEKQPPADVPSPPARIPPEELESLSRDVSQRPALAELPEWMQAQAGAPVKTEGEETTDWRRDLPLPAREVDESPPDQTEAEALPGWLQDIAEPEPSHAMLPQQVGEEETPDWLRDLPLAAEVAGEAASAQSKAEEPIDGRPDSAEAVSPSTVRHDEDQGLLDYLPETVAEEHAPARPSAAAAFDEELSEAFADLPDWLQAFADETLISQPLPAETVPAEEVSGLESGEIADRARRAPMGAEAGSAQDRKVDGETGREGAEQDQVPDWLQEILSQQSTGAAAPTPGPAGEIKEGTFDQFPDWLERLGLQTTGAGLAMPEPLGPEERPRAPEPRRTPKTGQLPSKMLTDWLGTVTAPGSGKKEPAASGQAKTGELPGTGPLVPPELPDWLAAVSTPFDADVLPDWLTLETEVAQTRETVSPAGSTDQAPEAPVPSWLAGEGGGPAVQSAAPEPAPAERRRASAESGLPDWLYLGPETPTLAPSEAPDWLASPDEIGAETAPEVGLKDVDVLALGLAQAEIPEWLRALKPREEKLGAPPEEVAARESVETGGPLNGLRGALAVAAAVTSPPTSTALPRFVVTEQQQAHERVLGRIVQGRVSIKPEPAPSRRRPGWFERSLIPLLIFLAVFLSALPPVAQALPFGAAEPISSPVIQETFALLEYLPDSATVVVAFDYGAAASGELNPIAKVLLRHLMQRNVHVLAVSTIPTGPGLAQQLMRQLLSTTDYRSGIRYLNLGYIPGGAAGLQAFAATPWKLFPKADYDGGQQSAREAPAAAGLSDSLRNVDLILVLTAERDDLVGWLEQVGRGPGVSTPIAAGISAGLEPWAQPYYYGDPGQLSGLVSGIPGAAQYEMVLDRSTPGDAVNLRNVQAAGLAMVVLLVAMGLLWGTVTSLTARRPRNG